ncbi:MAG: hypothetical protein AAB592_02625 [Patescibacteria group bacterium]
MDTRIKVGISAAVVVVVVALFATNTSLFQGRLQPGRTNLQGMTLRSETFRSTEYIPGRERVKVGSWKLLAAEDLDVSAFYLSTNARGNNYFNNTAIEVHAPSFNGYFGTAHTVNRSTGIVPPAGDTSGTLVENRGGLLILRAREMATIDVYTSISLSYPNVPETFNFFLSAHGTATSRTAKLSTQTVRGQSSRIRQIDRLEAYADYIEGMGVLSFHPNGEMYVLSFNVVSSAPVTVRRVRVRIEGMGSNVSSVSLRKYGNILGLGIPDSNGVVDFRIESPTEILGNTGSNSYNALSLNIIARATPGGVATPGDQLRFIVEEVEGIDNASAEVFMARGTPVQGWYYVVTTPVSEERCRIISKWLKAGDSISGDHPEAMEDYQKCYLQHSDVMGGDAGVV